MRSNYRAPTQVHAAEHKEIDRVMTIERGYITQSVTLAAAVALNNRYGFGADRIEQFAGLSYVSIGRYLQAPADKWPDMVRAEPPYRPSKKRCWTGSRRICLRTANDLLAPPNCTRRPGQPPLLSQNG